MATNPKLSHLAVGVIAQLTGYAPTRAAAAMRLRHVLTDGEGRDPILRAEQRRESPPALGEVAWVHAFGNFRRGLVVKVTPRKCLVAYVVPSNPHDIKVANVDHDRALLDGPKGNR